MQSYDPTIHIPGKRASNISSVTFDTGCRLASVNASDRSVYGGLQKRLRDLALEAALTTALERPNNGSRWAAFEWVAFRSVS